MLRSLAMADAAAVAELIRTAFAAQQVATDPLPSALRVTEADVVAHLQSGGGGAVMADEAGLVGSVLWEAQDSGWYIGRLAVAPTQRRRGIAALLLQEAEASARRHGATRLRLETRLVLHANRRLFAACGFVETGRTAHPGYTEPTSVILEKNLEASPRRG